MTKVLHRDRVVIRFAGDSGDGMQLTGDRFTSEAAAFDNDLATLSNFPAEIRAPQGTMAGVSSFQVHFADYDILTPGDRPDVLVVMNPAALKSNIADLPHRQAKIDGIQVPDLTVNDPNVFLDVVTGGGRAAA